MFMEVEKAMDQFLSNIQFIEEEIKDSIWLELDLINGKLKLLTVT